MSKEPDSTPAVVRLFPTLYLSNKQSVLSTLPVDSIPLSQLIHTSSFSPPSQFSGFGCFPPSLSPISPSLFFQLYSVFFDIPVARWISATLLPLGDIISPTVQSSLYTLHYNGPFSFHLPPPLFTKFAFLLYRATILTQGDSGNTRRRDG